MAGHCVAGQGSDTTHTIWAVLLTNNVVLSSFWSSGTKFLCSEVIAPIRSEIDDISLYIINFEDLSNPQQNDSLASRFSKCEYRARPESSHSAPERE